MKGKAHDDIGFDPAGRVIAIGEEAARAQEAIIEHPDSHPVLIVAEVDGEIGVRVFGPPSERIADLLDHVAAMYRKSLDLLTQDPQ